MIETRTSSLDILPTFREEGSANHLCRGTQIFSAILRQPGSPRCRSGKLYFKTRNCVLNHMAQKKMAHWLNERYALIFSPIIMKRFKKKEEKKENGSHKNIKGDKSKNLFGSSTAI